MDADAGLGQLGGVLEVLGQRLRLRGYQRKDVARDADAGAGQRSAEPRALAGEVPQAVARGRVYGITTWDQAVLLDAVATPLQDLSTALQGAVHELQEVDPR